MGCSDFGSDDAAGKIEQLVVDGARLMARL